MNILAWEGDLWRLDRYHCRFSEPISISQVLQHWRDFIDMYNSAILFTDYIQAPCCTCTRGSNYIII